MFSSTVLWHEPKCSKREWSWSEWKYQCRYALYGFRTMVSQAFIFYLLEHFSVVKVEIKKLGVESGSQTKHVKCERDVRFHDKCPQATSETLLQGPWRDMKYSCKRPGSSTHRSSWKMEKHCLQAWISIQSCFSGRKKMESNDVERQAHFKLNLILLGQSLFAVSWSLSWQLGQEILGYVKH